MTELRVRRTREEELQPVDVQNRFPVDLDPSQQIQALPVLFPTEWIPVAYGASSGALDANDAYGDMANAPAPRRARLLSIQVLDRDDVIAAGTLSIYLSKAAFTAAASDAAFTISVADGLKSFGPPVAFGPMTDVGSVRLLEAVDIDRDGVFPEGKVYFQLFTSGTPTPTAGGMPMVMFNWQVLG